MKIEDPWLSSADVNWQDGLDIETSAKLKLELLKSMIGLLKGSGVEFEEGSIAQVNDQIVLIRHFLRRLPHQYGTDGLCQEFYRLSGLDEDFDNFEDEEINKRIREVVSLARNSLKIDKL